VSSQEQLQYNNRANPRLFFQECQALDFQEKTIAGQHALQSCGAEFKNSGRKPSGVPHVV
jgi:hypothetical protein